MQDLKELRQLGFNEKKAKIYLSLLELGGASVIEISKKAKVKRTTAYNLIPELIAEGLVSKTKIKNKTTYLAEDPRNIQDNLEDKLAIAKSVLGKLMNIYSVIPFKPKVTFYEGASGMKKIYEDVLNSLRPGDTILSYGGLKNMWQLLPNNYVRKYFTRRTAKKIRIKLILPESKEAQDIKNESIKYLREVKIVDKTNYDFCGDVNIYADKVALLSYRENFLGLIIESKDIANMQRMAFELMWKGASQNNV